MHSPLALPAKARGSTQRCVQTNGKKDAVFRKMLVNKGVTRRRHDDRLFAVAIRSPTLHQMHKAADSSQKRLSSASSPAECKRHAKTSLLFFEGLVANCFCENRAEIYFLVHTETY